MNAAVRATICSTIAAPLMRLMPLSLALAVALTSCAPKPQGPAAPARATSECRVTRVVDGDTVHCRGLGSVRLIGIDAPERDQEPFSSQARRALERLTPVGSVVQLERDVEARDRFDRALGYLWRDGELVNWRMVHDGFAVTLTYPPNVQYVDALAAAQRDARQAARGLWATDGFACSPLEHRRGRC
jgi:micrococcal nuclease